MKLFIQLLLITAISTSSITYRAEANASHNQYEEQLEILLTSLQAVTGVPAFSVAVAHKGKLVASAAVGTVDRSKGHSATPDHLFRLASVSKVIGASMLAELVEEGRLDPDAQLGTFFPELDTKYHSITVRQLMAHTSGMPHYQAKDYDIYNKHYFSALDALETLKGRSLLSRPGTSYHYSSHGYTLAGAVHEKITGEPLSISLPTYIQEMTGRPTPMIEDITNPHPMASQLYEHSGSAFHLEEYGEKSYSIFGAGLSATAPDLALFGAAILYRSRQSDKLRQLMFTPVLTSDGGKTGRYLFEVGFGWRVGQDDHGRTVYHHAGATPGARSVLVLYPHEELAISFLSNAAWVSAIERTAFALADLYISGATSTQLPAGAYAATFGKETFSGTTACNKQGCTLESKGSPFSEYMNRYNSTGMAATSWPLHAYTSATGDRMVLAAKTGFISLANETEGKTFSAPIGRNNHLTISRKTGQ